MGRRRGDWEGHRGPARRPGGLGRALGLTTASAVVWGISHLNSGRRATGAFLLTTFVLMFGALGAGAAAFQGSEFYKNKIIQIATRPEVLAGIAVGLLVLALIWSTIVIRSYQLSRPPVLPRGLGALGGFLVVVLCLSVTTPLVYGAHTAYASRDLLNSLFPSAGTTGPAIDKDDPWKDKPRVNVLLLGGDAAGNRIGVRTDSMTLASIDTKTSETVLFSLPRNFENAPMPGRLKARFPNGFKNDDPNAPGLLNEVWQYAEDHPDLQPGVKKGQRGPKLLKAVIGEILGLRVDYYVLVDMFGFAGIIDAMGGVQIKIDQNIPYGQRGQFIRAGNRKLGGIEAMWYGRSRSDGSDYTRMGRQKCLLQAIAKQADPATVLAKFNRLAQATKRAVKTDLPRELIQPLVELSAKFKSGAQIKSLQFVPPVINPALPNFRIIRKKVTTAIAESEAKPAKPAQPSAQPSAPQTGGAAPVKRKKKADSATSLDLACAT
jgi:LCP family protein required for cell wall assembly